MFVGNITVLLIDDDEDDFVHIRDLLREMRDPCQVRWESSFSKGLEALKSGNFDICLLDYRLGERNGIEFLQEAQKFQVSSPIIFLTGQGDFELDVAAMQMGAADYLVKSQITPDSLERSIRYSMKRSLDIQELREREANFRTLFNSTFEGILVHRQGEIVDVNSGAAQIFGYGPNEMVGTKVSNYIDDANLADDREIVGHRKDGSEGFLEVAQRTISLGGHELSLTAIHDLTQRKQMEAQILQQDRLASLGLLASSLAHEIGTPLGIIRGRAELAIYNAGGNEKLTQDMNLIVSQIDRISKLVNSLLHLARDRRSNSAGTVNIQDPIWDVLALLKHELDRNQIEMDLNLDGNLLVRAEAGPLGQVVLNLLVNAVHAIQEAKKNGRTAGHKISLQIVPATKEDSVSLVIRDTGCGISKAHLKELFKPFFTTKDIGVGTGLGLATSLNLVQSWGGKIQVQSELNSGTTFTITLKRAT